MEEANPDTKIFGARLGAINAYAERLGFSNNNSSFNGNVEPQNLAKVLSYMERDFSDGSFDGKEISEKGESTSINSSELAQVQLTSNSADNFLKERFLNSVKDSVELHESYNENFWKGVLFCDSDDESCKISFNSNLPFEIYPSDGQTGVSSRFIIFISFLEEINPASLSVQAQDGTCSGTIQISSDGFNTCLGANLDADTTYAFIENFESFFQNGVTYKIKLKGIRKLDGSLLFSSPYTMSTGFTIAPPLYAISNDLIYDDYNYAVWTRCVIGKTWNGSSCVGTANTYAFCIFGNDFCNWNIPSGILSWGALFDACTSLDTIEYGGVTGWRVPFLWELETLNTHTSPSPSTLIDDYDEEVWSANSYDTTTAYSYTPGSSFQTNKYNSRAVRCITNIVPE